MPGGKARMTALSHIAARVLNRPLMITSQKAQVIAGVLGRRIGVDMALPERPQQEASRFHGRSTDYGYFVTEAGVAVIPIIGTLVNRGAWIGAHSGLVSYEGLDAQIRSAAEDGDVRAILLDMDTPGGEAAGAFELPALIREVRECFGERMVEYGPAKLNDMIRVYRMLYRQCGAGSGLPDLATGLQQRGGPVGGIFS